jgi:hypothetical protein
MPDLPLTGGCNCGAVRFEVAEPLVRAGYCHCRRCQRRTGCAASVQAFLAPGSLKLLSGTDHLGAWQPPDGYAKVFCSDCGSSLWSQTPDGEIGAVRLGVFDADPGIRPSYRQFLDFAAPFEAIPDDGLEHFGGRRA